MHRSVIDARKWMMATKEERMHATTWAGTTTIQDDIEHDKQLTTDSEDELKVWAYVMTQYNLKPGLRKFGMRGATAAVNELTQLQSWTRGRRWIRPKYRKRKEGELYHPYYS